MWHNKGLLCKKMCWLRHGQGSRKPTSIGNWFVQNFLQRHGNYWGGSYWPLLMIYQRKFNKLQSDKADTIEFWISFFTEYHRKSRLIHVYWKKWTQLFKSRILAILYFFLRNFFKSSWRSFEIVLWNIFGVFAFLTILWWS